MIKVTRKVKSTGGRNFVSSARASGSRLSQTKTRLSKRGEIAALDSRDLENQIKDIVLARVKYSVEYFHLAILSKTPVWSGTTIANYNWSLDRPVFQDLPFSGTEPGQTSKMPLGSEPNRPAAEAAATQSFDAMYSGLNSYKKIYLTNATEYKEGMTYMDLEYGFIPGGKLGSRVPPGGMYRSALKETENALSRLK